MKTLRSLLLSFVAVSASVVATAATAPAKIGGELNLFAWSEYVPQEVIDGFTQETGVTVNYETYASNEECLAKVLAGGTAYDLVQPTDYMAEIMIREKLLVPLDLAKIPLAGNIDPEFRGLVHDPEQKYSIPFMSGTVGIVVNTDVVKEPIGTYAAFFDKKHTGRLVVLNDNREMVTWALASEGISPNEITPENLKKARAILKQWLPLVKLFDSDSPKTALFNGDVDLGLVWSGEAAILCRENKKFMYYVPEGAHRFVDVLAIPTLSKNREAAHAFINYILRPEVSKIISDKFPYTNPNTKARALLSPSQLANPASYPKPTKLTTFRDIGKSAAEIDKLVTDLKNGL